MKLCSWGTSRRCVSNELVRNRSHAIYRTDIEPDPWCRITPLGLSELNMVSFNRNIWIRENFIKKSILITCDNTILKICAGSTTCHDLKREANLLIYVYDIICVYQSYRLVDEFYGTEARCSTRPCTVYRCDRKYLWLRRDILFQYNPGYRLDYTLVWMKTPIAALGLYR